MEHNPDATIEAYMFGNADALSNQCDSINDILNDDFKHELLFVHATTRYNHMFLQKGSINPNWILLDMGFSIDVFNNPYLLKDINKSEITTKIHCKSGVVHVTHMGTITGYGMVWYNKDDIANILSMGNSTKKYHVSYKSDSGEKFIIHKVNEQLVFNRSPSGL